MSRPAVEFSGARKRFGRHEALRGVDLVIPEGCFFGLLGHNGAGKSTLINAMAGLVRLTSGQIRVHGHDVVTEYAHTRRLLGVVPQELIDDPFFSVRELLHLQSGYFGLHGRAQRQWIDSLLHHLALTDKADVKTHQLSGGMKRRLLIAMALVHHPKVLVLDEPTAGVDVTLRQSLWQFVESLHQEGMTVILTTHYPEEAERLCERIAILDHGQVVMEADTPELLAQSPWKWIELEVEGEAVLCEPLSRTLENRQGERWIVRVARTLPMQTFLEWVRHSELAVRDMRIRQADLEQVFMQLTGADTSSSGGART